MTNPREHGSHAAPTFPVEGAIFETQRAGVREAPLSRLPRFS